MLRVALSADVSKPWDSEPVRLSNAEVAGVRFGLRGLDDIEMNSAAARAAHGPVLGAAAAGDDAQQRQRGIAIRAAGQHRRGLQGLFGGWKRGRAAG